MSPAARKRKPKKSEVEVPAGPGWALGDVLGAGRTPLVAVLEALVGPEEAAAALERAGVAPWLEAREVTGRQLARLVDAVAFVGG